MEPVSQRNVEWIVGRLVTDEGFRHRFWSDAGRTLAELAEEGCELNSCERRALLGISPQAAERFAAAIDPRIQKSDLRGGEW
jgi:hypothetical protein